MACPPSNVKFQLRRALASQWLSSPSLVLQAGEPGYETDTFKLKIGDGMTPWYSLPYIGQTNKILSDEISPIYTSNTTAESAFLTYKIVRVQTVSQLKLPAGTKDLNIRILNLSRQDLTVKDSSNATICIMYSEMVHFIYDGSSWIFFSGY
jgi:hypothetical protein